ncbi:DNA recombination protein RmuC [Vogesella sp. AC12]|uniref:DNA recombination protein RmuC n=1 Tax=Vogesella sp. AC12 TaxID=2950550 RepID=UPI00210BD1BB|nr:DNA recombination protein RmuC [Vogesella sp. AC12]MCQ4145129.1 DNA recombination protein RmuC [Vogesella sp. AC12]
MIELLMALLTGAGAGIAATWLVGKHRAEAAYQRGLGETAAQLAAALARGEALQWQVDDSHARTTALQQQLDSLRQLLSEAQQKLAVLANRAQRLPELEGQLQQQQLQLREQGERLAAREEQGRQLPLLQQELQQLRAAWQAQQNDLARLGAREQELLTLLQQEQRQSAEKLQLLQEAREALSNQFKALATDILEEKSKRFTEQNRENLGQLLGPLGERIQHFGKLVQDTYDKDSKERLTLEQELRRLQELNTRLNHDAVALTQALTGSNNKTQGNWGEMILERVLETSGLTRDREYRVQVSDTVETGEGGQKRYQPDVVIDLPEGKQLVIDSKVSLNAYVRYSASSDEAVRDSELKAHIAALRAHIRSLSEKRYQDLYKLNTLDFVFMFVPVEPAYLLAVQHDMGLFNEAFERRIMIVGPSTLLATLRTVASIWRYEHQNQNAQEIARQSGAMFDKLAGLVDTLEKLGKQIGTVQDSYGTAMKQLSTGSGNLLGRAEKLRKLGAKTSKHLPSHLLLDSDIAEETE